MASPFQNEPPAADDSRLDVRAYKTSAAAVFTSDFADRASDPSQSSARPHPHLGWAVLWVFVFWAVQIGVSFCVAMVAVAIAVAQGHTSAEQIERELANVSVVMIPIGTLSSVITAVLIAYIFYRRQLGVRLAVRGMTGLQCLASLLIVLPLGVIASEITNCMGEFLPSFNAEVLGQFAASPWPLVFATACLFPAIGEEIFCRGFLGRGLVANHGVVAGVLLASLLFGIMHIDPVQSIGAFVLGLGLHFIYLTTRSLIAPILVHMLNNAFAFWAIRNYQWCPLPGLSQLPDGSQVHTPPSVVIAAMVAGLSLFVLFYRIRTRWLLPTGNSSPGRETVWSPGYVTAEQPPRELGCRAVTAPTPYWLVAIAVLSFGALLAALAFESRAVSLP